MAGSSQQRAWPGATATKEDLEDDLDPSAFQERLWGLFTVNFRHTLMMPPRDRIRWHLFPEIRIQTQASLLDDVEAKPEQSPGDALLQAMDLQQEQLACSIGDGHRVNHGVVRLAHPGAVLQQAAVGAHRNHAPRPWHRGARQVRTFHSWCYDMVLKCAAASRSPFIVTHNVKDFRRTESPVRAL